jgi:hypothetical protein
VFGVGTPKYGSVYKRLNKIYHNMLEQKQTPPVFFHLPKVLAANSTTEERLEITPLQSSTIPHPVSVSFFKINATDVRKNDEFQKMYITFKPKEIVELQEIAQIALYTGEGTILVTDGNYKITKGSGIMYANEN